MRLCKGIIFFQERKKYGKIKADKNNKGGPREWCDGSVVNIQLEINQPNKLGQALVLIHGVEIARLDLSVGIRSF